MPSQNFSSGRIRQADYDPGSQQLDLHWDDRRVLSYRPVPAEVFRRLCAAPNPSVYWEDRIADEYPKGTPPKSAAASDAARQFGELFGGGDAG